MDGPIAQGESQPRVLTGLRQGANHGSQWRNALRVGDDANPFLELARLVPTFPSLDRDTRACDQGHELGGGPHANMRGIAQHLDGILQRRLARVFGADNVGDGERPSHLEDAQHFG
jgi:hypothetical protein